MQYLLRLVKKDLRFNAGEKHILDGLNESAYAAYQMCRDLKEIVEKSLRGDDLSVGSMKLGVPLRPMLVSDLWTIRGLDGSNDL